MARIISWLLNVAYLTLLAVLSPLIAWQAFRTGKYREGFWPKFFGLVPQRESDATCVWIHAVSVGEVNLLSTLLRGLRATHPDWEYVISTTSRAGYELATKKYADHTVFYCPLDFSWAVRTAVLRIRPSVLVLAELELWPNLILAVKEYGAPVAIINGRLSDRSFPSYKRVRWFVARMLSQIDLIAAQNNETATRFLALGAPPDRVHITGSLKYDGAQTDRHNPRTQVLRELACITNNDIVFLAGSTQEPEEQIAIDIFKRLAPQHPRLRLILVPRHPERFDDVAKALEASKLPWNRRSRLVNHSSQLIHSRDATHRRPILLVDSVGELAAWWGASTIAFVGGSFGTRGGQNMLEPAAYGAAVSFGPNTWNFRDIVASLLSADAAAVVKDASALENFVRHCLERPREAEAMGQRAQQLVCSQLGATDRTVALLNSLMSAEIKTVRSAA